MTEKMPKITLTLPQMRRVFRAAWYTPTPWGWGLPMLIDGIPGGGKTSVVVTEALAAGLGKAEVLSPGERGEGAFGVVPVPDMDLGVLTYPAPDWAARFIARDAAGLVFVDEITTADLSLQPSLLGLTLARRIGGTYLGKRVRVVAAGNLAGQGGANVTSLSGANANRFVHLSFPAAAVEGFTAFLTGRDVFAQMDETPPAAPVKAADEEARVRAAWDAAYAKAAGLVAGFLSGHGTRLHEMPEEGSDGESGAWPSPRTWDMLTLALAGSEIHKLTVEEADALLAGCVGEGPAAELRSYLDTLDLPNVADVLDRRVTWTPDPTRPDVIAAVLASGAALVTPKGAPLRKERAGEMWRVCLAVVGVAADLAIPAVQALSTAALFDAKNPACAKVLGTGGIHEMLVAAGLIKKAVA